MKTAYLYIRISTDKQARTEYGMDAQKLVCDAEAQKRHISDVRLLVEGKMVDGKLSGVSGSTELANRPAWKAILTQIKRGDVVIVSHRSRMARDPLIMNQAERALSKIGAELISVAGEGTDRPLDDPGAQFHRDITDAANRLEKGQVRVRTRAALAAQRARGERSSGEIPFGFQIKADNQHFMVLLSGKYVPRCGSLYPPCTGCRNLEENPQERTIIDKMRELAKEGMSMRAIARELDTIGMKKRNGKPWLHAQITRILARTTVEKVAVVE